ncbi:MAG TPA: protein kinase [Ktedonobacterales bacterium]|jgi:serine/threonine protein kinase
MGIDAGTSEQRLPEDLLGSVLGTCTLERILGRGGMGVVYLAQQSRPHRQVAVKVLLLSLMPDASRRTRFLERFRREADAIATLDHPNILPIYEYGEQADLAYLVMPHVTGGTLRDRVERKGPLPLAEVAGFLAQMASALDYAHTHGVIHRDVKPQNMLLYPNKRLMLSDFGIAKVAEQAAADEDGPTLPQLTTMGHVVGTPDYIAPEQAMGHPVDARADIYSLGVVLFYLVTGRVPFVGPQPMTVAAKHVSEPPPPPRQFRSDLPPAAEQVILKALEKDPAARYRSAGELSRAFRAALPSTLPEPPKTTAAPSPQAVAAAERALRQKQPPKKSRSGQRWLAILITSLLLILAAGGGYAAIRSNQPQPTAGPTTAPTKATTPTGTPSTETPTTGVTVTPAPTSPPTSTLYQAEQFLPQPGDLPAGTQATSPQIATTPQQFQDLNLPLAVDPTSGKYNWQKEAYVEVDQNGSAYLAVAIAQFSQAAGAQSYYADVAKLIQNPQTQNIGQQAIDGLCCGSSAADYNVVFQDQNVVAIMLAVASSDQAKSDGLNLAGNMDKHVHPAAQASQIDLWLADFQQPRITAAL